MKNKGYDEDYFSDCWIWDQRNKLKMELTEGFRPYPKYSSYTPFKIHIFKQYIYFLSKAKKICISSMYNVYAI